MVRNFVEGARSLNKKTTTTVVKVEEISTRSRHQQHEPVDLDVVMKPYLSMDFLLVIFQQDKRFLFLHKMTRHSLQW